MTWRFIILSAPATCANPKCGKLIRSGRGAWWKSGAVVCHACMRRSRGEAEETPEEQDLVIEAIDQIDRPRKGKG